MGTPEPRGYQFVLDERLGIRVPVLEREWADYSHADQEAMIEEWERIKARIPDRIEQLEATINELQAQVSQEDDWDRVIALYEEYYTIASIINDLNIWKFNDPQTSAHALPDDEPGISVEHANREQS